MRDCRPDHGAPTETEHTRENKRKGNEPTESAHTLEGKTEKPSVLDVRCSLPLLRMISFGCTIRMEPVAPPPLNPWSRFFAVRLTLSRVLASSIRFVMPPYLPSKLFAPSFYLSTNTALAGFPATTHIDARHDLRQSRTYACLGPQYVYRDMDHNGEK